MSSSYFNTVLRNVESIIAFEGDSLLDTLIYEIVQVFSSMMTLPALLLSMLPTNEMIIAKC